MLYFYPMPHTRKYIPYDTVGFVFWYTTLLNSDNYHKDMINVLMYTHRVNKHRSPFSPSGAWPQLSLLYEHDGSFY